MHNISWPPVQMEFEVVAHSNPEAVAVQFGSRVLRYGELNHWANHLAWCLIKEGVTPGGRVAICLDPGLATPLAVLGILKAGGTYVPVDPAYPKQRIDRILEDAGVSLVLNLKTLAEMLGGKVEPGAHGEEFVFPECPEIWMEDPGVVVEPGQVAYILYTSGSTGIPKGVAVSHRSLSYYLKWHREHLRTQAGGTDLPLTASMCFAAGVTQLYTPLLLGRTLQVLPRDMVRQPARLFAWYAEHPEFGIYCVPTLWNELVMFAASAAQDGRPMPGPKCVFLSGEAVPPALLGKSREIWPALQLWNLYGPTEATANGTAGELTPGQPVTLGKAIQGTRIYLVDAEMQEVAPGEEGEICICGPGVAEGYVNRPELTNTRFQSNPFDASCPDRLFKTGDIAKFNAEGELVFAGRRDAQVKIRGFRIECGEIEETLRQHPAVRQAVVGQRTDRELNKRLVAWVMFHGARYASVVELRQFLAASLPDYMIPERVVILDAIPVLANGKVDRSKLPSPGRERPDLGYVIAAPRTVCEQQLVRIWEEILGVEGIGAADDFFDLGGNSLKVASAIARIAEMLKSQISYQDFFQHPTPARLAKILTGKEGEGNAGHLKPLEPASAWSGRCGGNQQSLWLLTQRVPDITAYNIQFSLRFEGDLDETALATALSEIVHRHAILRSVIQVENSEPILKVEASPAEARIEKIDFSSLSRDVLAGEIARVKRTESEWKFSLDRGPLYRFALVRCPENRAELVVTVHHAIFDGASITVFSEEFLARYRARTGNGGYEHPRGAVQYLDYLAWRESSLSGLAKEEGAAFWRQELQGCTSTLSFPTDFVRPALQSFQGAREALFLSAEESAHLFAVSRKMEATPFMTMFAAYVFLLHRYSNQDEILVGCPVANRAHPDANALLGFFTNLIVLRTRLEHGHSFQQLIAQVREASLKAFQHQGVPFETILEVSKPERSLSRTPLFQVMFALHEPLFSGPVDENLKMAVVEDGNAGAKYDFALDVHQHLPGEGCELRLTYNTDLFAPDTMRRFLQQYASLLQTVLAEPDKALGDYELASADESRLILEDWNQTAFENARERGLHRLVEEQTAETPERSAVVFEDQELSYADLNRRANQLAHYLVARGVSSQQPVGVSMEMSPDLIVAILAIMKSGGTYLPLDPYYPMDRIAYIIQESGVSLILSQESLREANQRYEAEFVLVDLEAERIAAESIENPNIDVDPGHLIYLMYTSGSTGKPKGVMVPHRGACNYVLWMKHRFPLSPNDKVLNKTSINFDISVWEIFLPLISGAQLVLGKRETLQGAETLTELICHHGVTNVQFVPSALKAFADSGMLSSCRSLRRIFSGGEALSSGLQNQVFESFAGELHNLYGPTEASIYVCHWECQRQDRRRLVPIGHPMHNSKVFLFDDRMRPTPIGMTGEVYIGGDVALALGYKNKPEATAERFVNNPRSVDGKDAKLFKTGDLARYRPDGAIEFLGRADTQVKVRGYRIELGEIEHNLIRHPKIKHAVVIVREDDLDDRRLVAYLLYRESSGPTESELRAHLKQQIPDYMVPAHFVTLDSIPLLPNNKIDLKALPRPSYRKGLDHELERNYGSEIERTLASIWEDLLATSKFGLDDNFFDVGGHSLLMVRLQAMIHDQMKLKVSNIDLFQHSTIRSLAAHLSVGSNGGNQVSAEMAKRAQMRQERTRRRS